MSFFPHPPPPTGTVRYREPKPDPERVREARRGQDATAARLAEHDRQQKEAEEQFPLIERGNGQPPIRLRSAGGPPGLFPRSESGTILVGIPPKDPVDAVRAEVGDLRAEIASLRDLIAQATPTPRKRFRK